GAGSSVFLLLVYDICPKIWKVKRALFRLANTLTSSSRDQDGGLNSGFHARCARGRDDAHAAHSIASRTPTSGLAIGSVVRLAKSLQPRCSPLPEGEAALRTACRNRSV